MNSLGVDLSLSFRKWKLILPKKTYDEDEVMSKILYLIITATLCQAQNTNIVPDEYSKESIDRIFYQRNWTPTRKAEYNDFHYTRKSWEELKGLLLDHTISAKKLGVTNCSSYKSETDKRISLKRVMSFSILNSFYRWNSFDLKNKKKCIQLLFPEKKFLNKKEAQILLSASLGYKFDELGLNKPNIINKKEYFLNPTKHDCDGRYYLKQGQQLSDMMTKIVQLDGQCFRETSYPPKPRPSLSASKMMPKNPLLDLFRYILYKKKNCYLFFYKEDDTFQSPYICMKALPKYDILDSMIELNFTTEINEGVFDGFLMVFKDYSEKQREKILYQQVEKLLLDLGLSRDSVMKVYNNGLIDDIKTQIKSIRNKKIKAEIKRKIVIKINFSYGFDMNYKIIRDANGNMQIEKILGY